MSRNAQEDLHRVLHADLQVALQRLRDAEHSAVTLFARIHREGLYRSLGYATIELYATQALGLSESKTRQFLRLACALDALPATRTALDEGRLPWTKARTLAGVATPRTEGAWIQAAVHASSRELETKVKRARERRRCERDRLRRKRGQGALLLDTPQPATGPADAPAPAEIPVTVSIALTPVQAGRYDAMVETLRKRGDRRTRAELLLEGLAAVAETPGTRVQSATPYQIVAYRCEACNKTSVDGRPVTPAAADAMRCDAVLTSRNPKIPNKATIRPSIRRAVLARDGRRCTTEGCGARRFLEVHHIVPRTRGGSNAMENLTTLCGACHRFVHERGGI